MKLLNQKEVAKREKVTTKKESPKIKREEPKIIESDKSIKITNHNEDKNSPYSEVWKWPDEYFDREYTKKKI